MAMNSDRESPKWLVDMNPHHGFVHLEHKNTIPWDTSPEQASDPKRLSSVSKGRCANKTILFYIVSPIQPSISLSLWKKKNIFQLIVIDSLFNQQGKSTNVHFSKWKKGPKINRLMGHKTPFWYS